MLAGPSHLLTMGVVQWRELQPMEVEDRDDLSVKGSMGHR